MTTIKTGQLVRITELGIKDAAFDFRESYIGKTGRFISWRSVELLRARISAPKINDDGSYMGDFEFDPDDTDENYAAPCFFSVFVEPVED